MKKRLENLKKVVDGNLISYHYFQALGKTDNELDALYLTYYDLKRDVLRYNRCVFGVVNEIDYAPKINWNEYKSLYDYNASDISYTTSYVTSPTNIYYTNQAYCTY